MSTQDAEVAVIGAGPYGLSAASYLHARKRSVVVLGDPMSTWRDHMPVGMFLKSTPRASSIASPDSAHTFLAYRSSRGEASVDDNYPIPIAEFVAYGEWFAEQLVPVERDTVKRLERDHRGFSLTLDSGDQLRAAVVVCASGVVDFAYIPNELARLRSESAAIWHSSELNDLRALSGADVAVIGAGQSALETAVIANECGARVHLVARSERVIFGEPPGSYSFKPQSLLGPGWSLFSMERFPGLVRLLPSAQRDYLLRAILGPSGAWWLRPRFAGIDMHVGAAIRTAKREGESILLGLSNGEKLAVSQVIAATGYHSDPSRIGFLSDELRDKLRSPGQHIPRLSQNFESKVAGLFLTGLSAATSFGPLLRFVAGSQFASRRVTRGVSAALAS